MATQATYRVNIDDTFILIMGMSGAGKSTFINAYTGQPAQIVGHGLESCTLGPTIHSAELLDRSVHLIDTPGFNDNSRSDLEVLREIVFWAAEAYRVGIKISGIIYLHSIITPRLSGSALRGLKLFKHICGRDAYHGVVLLTTCWDLLSPGTREWQLAIERQRQLEVDFWADILDYGGTALPLMSPVTPTTVVEAIIRESHTLVLGIQTELNSGIGSLANTAAGNLLLNHYEEDRKNSEDRISQTEASLIQGIAESHDQNIIGARNYLRELNGLAEKQNERIWELQGSIREIVGLEQERILSQRKELVKFVSDSNAFNTTPGQSQDITARGVKSTEAALELHKRVKERHLASRIITRVKAEHISASAAVLAAGLAAGALCSVM